MSRKSQTFNWLPTHRISCKSVSFTVLLERSSCIASVAGSETTATALSAINYYMFKAPHARKQLQEEIRSAFKSYDEINATSTAPLKYMEAVCKEAMRLYTPLPLGLPRVVPPGGDTVNGDWLPGGVRGILH